MEAKNRGQNVVVWVVLALHVAVAVVLVVGPWRVKDTPEDLFFLAWPMGQCSLIALWAAMSRVRAYVRFPVALVGVACTWLLEMVVLGEAGWYGPESAGWALLFATQAAGIVIITMSGSLAWRLILHRRSGGASEAPATQYGLGSLMVWVTILALTLGFGKLVFAEWGWTPDVVKSEYFLFFPVIGAYNVLYALLILTSVLGRRWLLARGLAALILVGLAGYSQVYLLEMLFHDDGGTTAADWLVIAGGQAACLYATLLPLRLCGCFRGTMGAGESWRRSLGSSDQGGRETTTKDTK